MCVFAHCFFCKWHFKILGDKLLCVAQFSELFQGESFAVFILDFIPMVLRQEALNRLQTTETILSMPSKAIRAFGSDGLVVLSAVNESGKGTMP